MLTKKYQNKLTKVKKLVDTMTSALAVFETRVSKALNHVKIAEQEFGMLKKSHLKVINELSNVYCKMESETRTQLQKVYWNK